MGQWSTGGLGTGLLLVCRGFHSRACNCGEKSPYVIEIYKIRRHVRFGTRNALSDTGDLYLSGEGPGVRRYQQQEKSWEGLK